MIKIGLIPGVLIVLLSLGGSAALATETISERESIECQVCHVDPERSVESLTDQGLYYQYLKTLVGYEEVLERFDSCAYCHVDKAGSDALTAEGYRFQWMMEDMIGLRAWLEENHPRPAAEESSDQD